MDDYEKSARLYAVLTAVVVLLVVLAAIYALWDTGRTNGEHTQEARLACITEGSTWFESNPPACVAVPK